MQIIKKKEKIGELFFYIAVCLELLIMMTDQAGCSLSLRGRVAQLAFVLFGCKILTTEYSKKEWIVIVVAGLLGCISYFTCDEEYVLRAVMMIIAAKNIDVKKVLKLVLTVMFTVTVVMMLLSLTGIHGDLTEIRDFGRGKVECRWKFGFSHPNNIHDNFWYMTACYLLLRERKTKWFEYVILTLLNIGLFVLTASRNGFLAAQILICACVFFAFFPKTEKQKWPYFLGLLGLALCVLITCLAGSVSIYDSPFIKKLNYIFNGRIEMVYMNAPVMLWKCFPEARSLKEVDNGFASLFYLDGVVIGISYLLLLLFLFYRFYRKQNGIALAVLVTTILVTFMESTFIFNVSLLYNLAFILSFDSDAMHKDVQNIVEIERI